MNESSVCDAESFRLSMPSDLPSSPSRAERSTPFCGRPCEPGFPPREPHHYHERPCGLTRSSQSGERFFRLRRSHQLRNESMYDQLPPISWRVSILRLRSEWCYEQTCDRRPNDPKYVKRNAMLLQWSVFSRFSPYFWGPFLLGVVKTLSKLLLS